MLKKRKIFLLLGLAVLYIAAISCSSKSPNQTAPSSEKLVPAVPAQTKADWQSEWERITTGARKEGKLVLYTSGAGQLRAALTKILQDKFGIELEFSSGRGSEIVNKLLAERKAGIFYADVFVGGTTTFIDQLQPANIMERLEPQLLLPEVLDPKAWWNGQLPFVDKDKQLLALLAKPFLPFIVNGNLVKEEELRSYRDVLNPKWKGSIIMDDPTVAGSGLGTFAVLSYVLLNMDFYRQLARMDPVVTRDKRQLVEWVARGKSAIGFCPQEETLTEFKKAGAPLREVMPVEGTYISSGGGNIAILLKAPHPNAARVFANWLLTKEGGTVYSQTTGNQSARSDVPTNHLQPATLRQPGTKYFNYIDEEFLKQKSEQVKAAIEIFSPLLR